MIQNKKGIASAIIAVIAIVVILLIVLIASGASGASTLPSYYTETPAGCTPKQVGVTVEGILFVEDTAWFGVEPSIKKVSVDAVRIQRSTLGVFSEDYTWKVEAIDPVSGNQLTSYQKSSTHEGDGLTQENEYILSFRMPDNNCDGQVDDFDLVIKATINADRLGPKPADQLLLKYRNGRATIS